MRMMITPEGMTKRLSTDEMIVNCLLALWYWHEVKPETVDLSLWGDCGTHACFGGHLVTWPEFQALGVKMLFGEPWVEGVGTGFGVADYLFGTPRLFYVVTGETIRSDWEIVIERLENQIAALSERL